MTQRLVGGSVSFDHAADVYDTTRALPPEIVARQAEAILTELRAARADRLLEVGIGTGRCSRPLMERGVRLAGVDIAPKMIARLREQLSPRHLPPDLLFGDATRLPFCDASFRAVLAVHVLHLVADWKRTIEELRRVLAPGGVFLHDRTRYDEENPWQRTFQKREELAAALGCTWRKRPGPEDIAAKLEALGATLRTVVYAENDERDVAAEVINRTRNRVDSWTWEIPDEIFPTFFSQYEAYVLQELGGPDFAHTTHVTYQMEVWSFG
jgi:SAM-dependent methyltransferase